MLFYFFFLSLKKLSGRLAIESSDVRERSETWLKKPCRGQSLSTILLHRLSIQSIAISPPRLENGFERWKDAKYGRAFLNKYWIFHQFRVQAVCKK